VVSLNCSAGGYILLCASNKDLKQICGRVMKQKLYSTEVYLYFLTFLLWVVSLSSENLILLKLAPSSPLYSFSDRLNVDLKLQMLIIKYSNSPIITVNFVISLVLQCKLPQLIQFSLTRNSGFIVKYRMSLTELVSEPCHTNTCTCSVPCCTAICT
jgi:hypothetical protein